MCSRYLLQSTTGQMQKKYAAVPDRFFEATWNVSPAKEVPIVLQTPKDRPKDRKIELYRWGLIPAWLEDPSKNNPIITARAEVLALHPACREGYIKRRCVVPANGFFEWQQTPDGKIPIFITLPEGELMSFAGIYEHWSGNDRNIHSFTIITTAANNQISELTDRMPALLLSFEIDEWLDPDHQNTSHLQELLHPYPHELRFHKYPEMYYRKSWRGIN